jgi:hypothetical protein
MVKVYVANDDRTTLDRKAEQARVRSSRKSERKEAIRILNAMKELRVRRIVAQAERSQKVRTKEGRLRTYRFRANVAAMACRLLYWEGRGELSGGWVYKSSTEWKEETGLTEKMQRTARRVGQEEGLWEEDEHTRRDGRTVVAYRLDAWRLWQVVNQAELDSAKEKLVHARNPARKAELREEIRELERTRATLGLGDAPDVDTEVTSKNTDTYGENDSLDCETQPSEPLPPAIMSGVPLHIGEHAREYPRGFPLSDDPPGGLETSPAPRSTPPAPSSSEDTSTQTVESDVEAYEKLYRQVEAVLRGDCQSESAREVLGPLVERNLGGQYAVTPGVIAKVVRGFVRVPEDGVDLAGVVEEVLDEIRIEEVTGGDPDTPGDDGGQAPVLPASVADADVPEPERPPLTGSQKGELMRLVLAWGRQTEVGRLADRCAAGEDVTPEEVAQQAIGHLPGDRPPLEAVVASVEGLLVGMRGEWP